MFGAARYSWGVQHWVGCFGACMRHTKQQQGSRPCELYSSTSGPHSHQVIATACLASLCGKSKTQSPVDDRAIGFIIRFLEKTAQVANARSAGAFGESMLRIATIQTGTPGECLGRIESHFLLACSGLNFLYMTMHTNIYTYMYTCMFVCMYVCMHACMHVCK